MYVLIAIAAIVLHHYLTDSDTALFFAALGVALVIVVNLFALIGFCTACASLKREGREWRGVMGFIVNALALWPVWYIVTCLLQGIICWGVYAFLAGIAYAALAMGGGDFVFLCIPLAVVMQLYALQGFIDGCRSLRSESRDWRGIAGLIVNLAALLPIPCALLAVIAFA